VKRQERENREWEEQKRLRKERMQANLNKYFQLLDENRNLSKDTDNNNAAKSNEQLEAETRIRRYLTNTLNQLDSYIRLARAHVKEYEKKIEALEQRKLQLENRKGEAQFAADSFQRAADELAARNAAGDHSHLSRSSGELRQVVESESGDSIPMQEFNRG